MTPAQATNHLSIDERMIHGKRREKEILALLNSNSTDVVVEGVRYTNFIPSTNRDDMYNKIDAWCTSDADDRAHSVQIKFRDRGEDVGIAAIRPYRTHEEFVRDVERDDVEYDRDLRSDVDLYVCVVDNGSALVVTTGKKIKRACSIVLSAFADSDGFEGRSWYRDKYRGTVLKLVTDRGDGYTYGQDKIVVYIAPWLLQRVGAYWKRLK